MTQPNSPARESTPAIPSLKRTIEEDHQPSISSPLNPHERSARAKKDSFKKRADKPAPEAHIDTLAPLRYKLPPPKGADFEPPNGPIFTPHHTITAPDGTLIEFNEASEQLLNKKGFRYLHCIADPTFPSNPWRQSETEPFGPRLDFEDCATHMFLDQTARHITTDKGWRVVRANVVARSGRRYYECKITSGIPKPKRGDGSTNGHVRMGWARREATLDSLVGFDCYSYGVRDVEGQSIHMSRPKKLFPPGEDIQEGDVIGLEINLPSETLHRKVVEGSYNPALDLDDDEVSNEAADIIRDRVPIRFKSHLYFEQIDYSTTKELEDLWNPSPVISSSGGLRSGGQPPGPNHPIPSMRTLPHSSIKVYKNGILMGTPFSDLFAFLPPASRPQESQLGARDGLDDGMLGYFPAISVFRGGAAQINLGPDFWFPPPTEDDDDEVEMIGSNQILPIKKSKMRPMSERYDEQIAEDIMHDLIDEVDFWVQDGGFNQRVGGGRRFTAGAGLSDKFIPSGEIKELIQDVE